MGTGQCADPTEIAYVSNGGTDTGDCTDAAPCATIAFAYTKLGGRNQIFIIGATYAAPATIELGSATVTISSDHATVTGGSPIFHSLGGASVDATLTAMTIGVSGQTAKGVALDGAGKVMLLDVKLEQPFSCAASTLLIEKCTLDVGGSTGGTTTVERSTLHDLITVTGGVFKYDSNQYSGNGRAIESNAANAQIFDSLFVANGATASFVDLHNTERLSFCTFVDLQPSGVAPFTCDPNFFESVSAVINASNSSGSACSVDHSLFNGAPPPAGTGNLSGSASMFFVDLAGQDFHLAAGSPALRGGTGGIPGGDHDLGGGIRPLPSGSAPDIGAYESAN